MGKVFRIVMSVLCMCYIAWHAVKERRAHTFERQLQSQVDDLKRALTNLPSRAVSGPIAAPRLVRKLPEFVRCIDGAFTDCAGMRGPVGADYVSIDGSWYKAGDVSPQGVIVRVCPNSHAIALDAYGRQALLFPSAVESNSLATVAHKGAAFGHADSAD